MVKKSLKGDGLNFGSGQVTKSAPETQKLGEKIAIDLVGSRKHEARRKSAVVLALSGNLGSGKTTFLQGFAKGLGIKQRIISPTFILMRQYKTGSKNQEAGIRNFYHVDLYRLEKNVERELVNLGFNEIISDPENVIAIEWADKAKGAYPKKTIWIKFENIGENKRKIII